MRPPATTRGSTTTAPVLANDAPFDGFLLGATDGLPAGDDGGALGPPVAGGVGTSVAGDEGSTDGGALGPSVAGGVGSSVAGGVGSTLTKPKSRDGSRSPSLTRSVDSAEPVEESLPRS